MKRKQSHNAWSEIFLKKHPHNDWWESRMREQARKEEDLSQKKNFVIHSTKAFNISIAICTGSAALAGGLIHFFAEDKVDIAIAIFLYALASFLLFGFLHLISYRCTVDEEKIVKEFFWLFKKEILWSRVKYKRIKHRNAVEGKSIVLYDERKKRLIDFDPVEVGYTNMELLIKRKKIPSRHQRQKKN